MVLARMLVSMEVGDRKDEKEKPGDKVGSSLSSQTKRVQKSN